MSPKKKRTSANEHISELLLELKNYNLALQQETYCSEEERQYLLQNIADNQFVIQSEAQTLPLDYKSLAKYLYYESIGEAVQHIILYHPQTQMFCGRIRQNAELLYLIRQNNKKTFEELFEIASAEDKKLLALMFPVQRWIRKALSEDFERNMFIDSFSYIMDDGPEIEKHMEKLTFHELSDMLEDVQADIIYNANCIQEWFRELFIQKLDVIVAFYKVFLKRTKKESEVLEF